MTAATDAKAAALSAAEHYLHFEAHSAHPNNANIVSALKYSKCCKDSHARGKAPAEDGKPKPMCDGKDYVCTALNGFPANAVYVLPRIFSFFYQIHCPYNPALYISFAFSFSKINKERKKERKYIFTILLNSDDAVILAANDLSGEDYAEANNYIVFHHVILIFKKYHEVYPWDVSIIPLLEMYKQKMLYAPAEYNHLAAPHNSEHCWICLEKQAKDNL